MVPTCRGADRRRDGRTHAGGGAHVPLRQPRRAPGAAAHHRHLRHGAGDRSGQDEVARARCNPGRVRIPDQDAPGLPGRPRLRPRLPAGRAGLAATADRSARNRPRDHGRRVGLVGRDRAADPRGGPAVHRRIAGQQPSQPDLRLQRPGQADRQRVRAASVEPAPTGRCGARPVSTGCSTSASAARSRGCSRPPSSC